MKSFILQIGKLFSYKDKWHFVFIALLMALSALLELAGLSVLVGAATLFLSPDTPAGQQAAEFIIRWLPELPEEKVIAVIILAIGVLLVLKNIFALIIVDLQAKFVHAGRNELANRIMHRFLHADYRHFSALPVDFCFGAIQRVNVLSDFVLLPVMQVTADVLAIAVLSVTAIFLFPVVTLSGIVFMVMIAMAVSHCSGKLNRRYGRGKLNAELEENKWRQNAVSGVKAIKISAKEEYFLRRFSEKYAEMNLFNRKLYTLGQVPRLVLESASIFLAAAVFAVMVLCGVEKSSILFSFAVLTAVVSRILPALSRCHYNLTLIRQNYPILENIAELLSSIPEEKAASGTAADASETLEIRNVNFSYREGKPVLENISLFVPHGTSLAISGKSGRGKSTLIDLILGLLMPQNGMICAGNVPIANDLSAWRKQIGVVPQNIFLHEGSIRENVAFGEDPECIDDEKVKSSLQLVGLGNFSPDHPVSARGNLSGGQQQRIGIARALYRDAKVLILDEATSALDSETENQFCEVIRNLRGKVTVIVISHRESTLNICDRQIEL